MPVGCGVAIENKGEDQEGILKMTGNSFHTPVQLQEVVSNENYGWKES